MSDKPVLEKVVKVHTKRRLLKLYPDAWVYMPVQTGYGQHGIPDFIACVPVEITQEMVGKKVGVFVGLETKREGGKLSAFQELQLDAIKKAAGIGLVVTGIKEMFETSFALLRSKLFDR